jgi:hypothetical protein
MSYNQNIASSVKYGSVKAGSGIDITEGVISTTGINTSSYYGKFFSSTTQTNPTINTARLINFPNTVLSNEITTSGTTITVNKAGIYTITYEVQAEITSGGGGNIDIWVANNVQLPNSNSITTLAGGGTRTIINRSFLVTLTAGETVRVFWSSPIANMQLTATPAQTGPVRPATNSANFLATLVQAL